MSVDSVATGNFADRISEQLAPIHRGAIQIGNKIAVFGNDNYSATGVSEIAQKVWHWLSWKGWSPTAVEVCAEKNTWVITASPGKKIAHACHFANRCVWNAWKRTPNRGRTAPHAGEFQMYLAQAELDAIGGGYADDSLTIPLDGKCGRVRGGCLIGSLMMRLAADGEDAHILLGGVPFPVKMLPLSESPTMGFCYPPTSERQSPPEWLEVAVVTEDVGDPRNDGNGTATAFLAAGNTVMVRHFGAIHETTGRRILVPVNSSTGEPIPD